MVQDSEKKKKIKITVKTKKKANNTDRSNNSLEGQSTRNEVAHALLLVKALRESLLAKSDRGGQGGHFIKGSMQRLSSNIWKGVIHPL